MKNLKEFYYPNGGHIGYSCLFLKAINNIKASKLVDMIGKAVYDNNYQALWEVETVLVSENMNLTKKGASLLRLCRSLQMPSKALSPVQEYLAL